MSDCVIALTTWPGDADAAKVAEEMVAARLAACVTIVPGVRSVYMWKGETTVDVEQQLMIKTTSDRLDVLRTWVVERHPYELPEWMVVAVAGGGPDYLAWIRSSVTVQA